MSKTRVIGIVLLIIGICLFYVLNSTNWSLLGAAMIGFGVGLILIGKVGPNKK
ncbi:MAG: hypothetical protein ACKVJF_00840 [Flavobacteriales bacterium]